MSVQPAGSSFLQPAPQQARPIATWTGPDALNVSTDVLDLFVSVTTPIPLVGSILAPVLSGVKNIVVMVKSSRDNKAAAEDLARRILKYVKQTAERIQDAQVLLDPQSTFTRTMWDLARDLDDLFKKLGEQPQGRFGRFLDHEAVKGMIDAANVDFNDARLNQMNGLVIGLYEGKQHNAGPTPSFPSASPSDSAGPPTPGPSVASSTSTSNPSNQDRFQQTVTDAHPYSLAIYKHSQDGVQAVLDADIEARIAEKRRKEKLAVYGLS